jgi:hypothetical protein
MSTAPDELPVPIATRTPLSVKSVAPAGREGKKRTVVCQCGYTRHEQRDEEKYQSEYTHDSHALFPLGQTAL